jgi:MoxR-like ATPase
MAGAIDIRELNERIERQSAFVTNLMTGMDQVIVGQKHLIESLLIGLLSDGHILLEGVPGLAKTLAIKTLSSLIDAKYSRIQFTPDLLPADVIGTMIYSQKDEQFIAKRGPIFANFVLADEINRAPAKVQSALLEAMQERQVTLSKETFELPKPFLVMATQNPIEQEGTYPLPEAQLDRFMFNLKLDYPTYEEEIEVVKNTTSAKVTDINPVMTAEEIIYFQNLVRRVPVADNVYEYAVGLVSRTRPNTERAHEWSNKYLSWGAGPRASQYLIIGAKANALLKGKLSPDIEDVQEVALPILRHRLVRNYSAEAEGIGIDKIVKTIL